MQQKYGLASEASLLSGAGHIEDLLAKLQWIKIIHLWKEKGDQDVISNCQPQGLVNQDRKKSPSKVSLK